MVDDIKALRDRVKDLKDKDEVRDNASRLLDDANRLLEEVNRLQERIRADFRTLDRVKNGVMNGANNPLIRARMEYGKEMHIQLQKDRGCAEKELVLSSGRPDCVKFDSGDCKVIEFKPDTYSESAAREQAARYIDDVRRKFKDDDRAKDCKKDADGPKFLPVGELYRACRKP